MSPSKAQICEDALRTVTAAADSTRAAMLTESQYTELVRLVTACESACDAGDATEARRIEHLVTDILREGPPSYG